MLDELTQVSVDLRLEKARKCLQVAESLITSEAYADAANRSYYCIFHAMHAVLITKGFTSKTHSGSIAEFRKSYIKTGVFLTEFSDFIEKAFKVRSKSDYDIYYVVAKSDVVTQLENAKVFLAAVEAYIKTL